MMTIFEILTLRSEYEDFTLNYRVPGDKKPGTLANMKWFVKHGAERNSRKEGFSRVLEIATMIVDYETSRKT